MIGRLATSHGGNEVDQFTALRVFSEVARAGSFSRAARVLRLSKSAVSKYVAGLEDMLGVKLLRRTTRHVSLTEDGTNYLGRVRHILEEFDDANRSLSGAGAPPRGTLRVNSALAFGVRHIAPAIPHFLRRYPEIRIDLELADRFVDLVEEGFDLAIRIGALNDSSLVVRRLARARILLVAAPAYLEAQGVPRSPAGLADHACLLYRGRHGFSEWRLDDGSAMRAFRVSGPMVSNNGEALAAAACGGLGIARLPAFMIENEIKDGRLVEILPECRPESEPVHAVFPSSQHLSQKVRLFTDFLAGHLGRHVREGAD